MRRPGGSACVTLFSTSPIQFRSIVYTAQWRYRAYWKDPIPTRPPLTANGRFCSISRVNSRRMCHPPVDKYTVAMA